MASADDDTGMVVVGTVGALRADVGPAGAAPGLASGRDTAPPPPLHAASSSAAPSRRTARTVS